MTKQYVSIEKVETTVNKFNELLAKEMRENNYNPDDLDVQLRGTLIPECGHEPVFLGGSTLEEWELTDLEDVQAEINKYIQAHYDEPSLNGKFDIDLTVGYFYEIDDEEKFPCDVIDSCVTFFNTEDE